MNEKHIPRLARELGIPAGSAVLLQEALTHRTYAVEHGLKYDIQRLEFLGDAVLEIIQTEYLYFRYPQLSEGDMTKIRSALSCESTLANIARQLNLGSYLLIGNAFVSLCFKVCVETSCNKFDFKKLTKAFFVKTL